MKCIGIDDEPLALEVLKGYISKYPSLQLLGTFDDAVEGATFLKQNTVDLLFIDINMPDLTGLELVSGLIHKPIVIFTTAHKRFAHEGFELEALDYLLKPIAPERFEKAVNRALAQFAFRNTQTSEVSEPLIVRSEYKMVKIDLADIEYIESMEDYIKIHRLSSPHPVLTLMSLKSILLLLPQGEFCRIHRSYIVPASRVSLIQSKRAILDTGKELPISDSYLDFIEHWKNR